MLIHNSNKMLSSCLLLEDIDKVGISGTTSIDAESLSNLVRTYKGHMAKLTHQNLTFALVFLNNLDFYK